MCLGQHQFCPNYRLLSRLLTNLDDSENKRWFSKIKSEGISCEAINHYLQNAHHAFFLPICTCLGGVHYPLNIQNVA